MKKKIFVKREIWGGKSVVVRRESGRLVAWRRWRKGFRVGDANRIYKSNRSFNENVFKRTRRGWNVVEVTDLRKQRPSGKAQYVFSAKTKDGLEVGGRSDSYYGGEKKKTEVVNEAKSRFYSNYAEKTGIGYDEGLGQDFFNSEVRAGGIESFVQGWVYYIRKKRARA